MHTPNIAAAIGAALRDYGRRALLLMLLVAAAAPALAQPAPAAQSARRDTITTAWTDPGIATVILVDALPAPAAPNARAVVIRRPGELPNNIILVTEATTGRDLAKAVTALAFSRRNKGDHVEREMRTTVVASVAATGKPTKDELRAERDLRRVKAAPEFAVAGLARGRAISIRMAESAVRGKPPTAAKPSKH